MKLPDFNDITYLSAGSTIQQKVYRLLSLGVVPDTLSPFSPVVIGTFPLDIAIQTSDIDIACCVSDMGCFRDTLRRHFGFFDRYTFKTRIIQKKTVGIANFMLEDIAIEVYGEDSPVAEQAGYRHMVAEFKLLQKYGDSLRSAVIELKSRGWKTEPAFAEVLGLSGDPYQALLKFKFKNDDHRQAGYS